MRDEQRQCFLPRLRIDELGDGRIGTAVRRQHAGGADAQCPQRLAAQRVGRPRAQEFTEQCMKGVGRRCAVAPVGEQAAARQAGQQLAGVGVAADSHRHRRRGAGQEGHAHQRRGVRRRHLLHHFTGEEGEQPVTRRAVAQRVVGAQLGAGREQQDHRRCPAVGDAPQFSRLPGPVVQADEALGVVFGEAQRRFVDHDELLAGQHARVLRRRGFAADGHHARALGQFGQCGSDAGVQQRRSAQLLHVVQHQHPGQVEPQGQAAETSADEGRHVAQVVGAGQGQAQRAAWCHQRRCRTQKVDEGRGIGVARIELQPQAGNGTRFEVGGHQGGLADAGRPRDPRAGDGGRLVELRKQPVAAEHAAQAGRAQLAERGLAGCARGGHRAHVRARAGHPDDTAPARSTARPPR